MKDLETERLILRKFKIDDAEAMFNNWAVGCENAVGTAELNPKIVTSKLNFMLF